MRYSRDLALVYIIWPMVQLHLFPLKFPNLSLMFSEDLLLLKIQILVNLEVGLGQTAEGLVLPP